MVLAAWHNKGQSKPMRFWPYGTQVPVRWRRVARKASALVAVWHSRPLYVPLRATGPVRFWPCVPRGQYVLVLIASGQSVSLGLLGRGSLELLVG